MAALICGACRNSLDPDSTLCPTCGYFNPGDEGPTHPTPATTASNTTTPGHHPDAQADAQDPICRVCDRPVRGDVCDLCGTALTRQVVVHLPDGARLVLTEGIAVALGRESTEPVVTAALGPLDTVSRHHAQVTLHGTEVEVADLRSTNGTWLDGEKLGSRPERRALPVRIGLGRSVTVEIRGTP